jgi:hypothetical protein
LYEVDAPVAQVLLTAGYAERHPRPVTPTAAVMTGCSKCGSRQTAVIGQTEIPPLRHIKCRSCGYISVHPLD